MRKIKLFIACSIDGYIARKDNGLDWLFSDADYGYTEFYESIDTTLMGYKTYEQILTFEAFPMQDKANIVFTRRDDRTPDTHVSFVSGDICAFTAKLKEQPGKDIWLVGGGEVITALNHAGLIDEYIISYHPIILGDGIPLFLKDSIETHLGLVSATPYPSGLVQMHYVRVTEEDQVI